LTELKTGTTVGLSVSWPGPGTAGKRLPVTAGVTDRAGGTGNLAAPLTGDTVTGPGAAAAGAMATTMAAPGSTVARRTLPIPGLRAVLPRPRRRATAPPDASHLTMISS